MPCIVCEDIGLVTNDGTNRPWKLDFTDMDLVHIVLGNNPKVGVMGCPLCHKYTWVPDSTWEEVATAEAALAASEWHLPE